MLQSGGIEGAVTPTPKKAKNAPESVSLNGELAVLAVSHLLTGGSFNISQNRP